MITKDSDIEQSEKDVGNSSGDFPFPGDKIGDYEKVGGGEVYEECYYLLREGALLKHVEGKDTDKENKKDSEDSWDEVEQPSF